MDHLGTRRRRMTCTAFACVCTGTSLRQVVVVVLLLMLFLKLLTIRGDVVRADSFVIHALQCLALQQGLRACCEVLRQETQDMLLELLVNLDESLMDLWRSTGRV